MVGTERKTAEVRREEILAAGLEGVGEHRLRAQMQAYADCDDPEVRAVVREGYGALVEYVERISGADADRVRDFFAFGMLLNVFASMDLLNQDAPWAKRLLEASLPPQ